MNWLYIPFRHYSVERFLNAGLMSYFQGKTIGKSQKWLGNLLLITVRECYTVTPSKKPINIFVFFFLLEGKYSRRNVKSNISYKN